MFLTVLLVSMSAAPQPSYMEAYKQAVKENKQLFVWRGLKDDYVVNKYKNAIHVFDPDMKGIKNTFPAKGVIVAVPNKAKGLDIQIETTQIGELCDKLTAPKVATPVYRIISGNSKSQCSGPNCPNQR